MLGRKEERNLTTQLEAFSSSLGRQLGDEVVTYA